jgi:hypothetical protein
MALIQSKHDEFMASLDVINPNDQMEKNVVGYSFLLKNEWPIRING